MFIPYESASAHDFLDHGKSGLKLRSLELVILGEENRSDGSIPFGDDPESEAACARIDRHKPETFDQRFLVGDPIFFADLTSLPASVRYQLSKADHFVEQGRPAEARNALAEALKTLAQTNPEYCALVLGTQLGFKELSGTQKNTTITTTRMKKRVLGVCYGEDVTTVTTENVTTRSLRFS